MQTRPSDHDANNTNTSASIEENDFGGQFSLEFHPNEYEFEEMLLLDSVIPLTTRPEGEWLLDDTTTAGQEAPPCVTEIENNYVDYLRQDLEESDDPSFTSWTQTEVTATDKFNDCLPFPYVVISNLIILHMPALTKVEFYQVSTRVASKVRVLEEGHKNFLVTVNSDLQQVCITCKKHTSLSAAALQEIKENFTIKKKSSNPQARVAIRIGHASGCGQKRKQTDARNDIEATARKKQKWQDERSHIKEILDYLDSPDGQAEKSKEYFNATLPLYYWVKGVIIIFDLTHKNLERGNISNFLERFARKFIIYNQENQHRQYEFHRFAKEKKCCVKIIHANDYLTAQDLVELREKISCAIDADTANNRPVIYKKPSQYQLLFQPSKSNTRSAFFFNDRLPFFYWVENNRIILAAKLREDEMNKYMSTLRGTITSLNRGLGKEKYKISLRRKENKICLIVNDCISLDEVALNKVKAELTLCPVDIVNLQAELAVPSASRLPQTPSKKVGQAVTRNPSNHGQVITQPPSDRPLQPPRNRIVPAPFQFTTAEPNSDAIQESRQVVPQPRCQSQRLPSIRSMVSWSEPEAEHQPPLVQQQPSHIQLLPSIGSIFQLPPLQPSSLQQSNNHIASRFFQTK